MLSGWARVRFAAGDFAFNLLWQSVSIYLVYYYTDVLGLAVETAALIFMVGSMWDGIADLAVGLLLDRLGGARGAYRRVIAVGAVPLGLAFVAVYAVPVAGAGRSAAVLLMVQLAFRTVYAATNVSYAALTTRITQASGERASIVGLRMVFGTLAAALVAFGTAPVARLAGGQTDSAAGFLAVAVVLGLGATAVLLPVALAVSEDRSLPPAATSPQMFGVDVWRSVTGNAALLWLGAAMAGAIAAMTVLTKMTLYYFKYVVGDAAAGTYALGWLGIVGGVAVPVWMAFGRKLDRRRVWLAAAALGLAAIAAYAAIGGHGALAAQIFLGAVQFAFVGINFAFWSMLPDTIEYGERATGLRMEATSFGLAALSQKLALGTVTGVFGLAMGWVGYRANAAQLPATLAGMRGIMLGLPAAALIASAACIAANPLRRGTHALIVAELLARIPS